MIEEIRRVLERDGRIAFALLFGSRARGTAHPGSDVDVAVGLVPGTRLGALEMGELASRVEAAARRPVDLVDLGEGPPGSPTASSATAGFSSSATTLSSSKGRRGPCSSTSTSSRSRSSAPGGS